MIGSEFASGDAQLILTEVLTDAVVAAIILLGIPEAFIVTTLVENAPLP